MATASTRISRRVNAPRADVYRALMRGEMKVTFTLTDADSGTDVFAVHDNLPPGLSPADNETGWRMALDKLAAFVEADENN